MASARRDAQVCVVFCCGKRRLCKANTKKDDKNTCFFCLCICFPYVVKHFYICSMLWFRFWFWAVWLLVGENVLDLHDRLSHLQMEDGLFFMICPYIFPISNWRPLELSSNLRATWKDGSLKKSRLPPRNQDFLAALPTILKQHQRSVEGRGRGQNGRTDVLVATIWHWSDLKWIEHVIHFVWILFWSSEILSCHVLQWTQFLKGQTWGVLAPLPRWWQVWCFGDDPLDPCVLCTSQCWATARQRLFGRSEATRIIWVHGGCF